MFVWYISVLMRAQHKIIYVSMWMMESNQIVWWNLKLLETSQGFVYMLCPTFNQGMNFCMTMGMAEICGGERRYVCLSNVKYNCLTLFKEDPTVRNHVHIVISNNSAYMLWLLKRFINEHMQFRMYLETLLCQYWYENYLVDMTSLAFQIFNLFYNRLMKQVILLFLYLLLMSLVNAFLWLLCSPGVAYSNRTVRTSVHLSVCRFSASWLFLNF